MDMVIIWAIVIAVALVLEFVTYAFVSVWFVGGGLVSLILAACGVDINLQITLFVIVSGVLLVSMRPLVKRFTKTEKVPTNADANIGKTFKLVSGIKEGRGTIKINDIVWTVVCEEPLKEGEKVVITEISGNKYIAKKAEVK